MIVRVAAGILLVAYAIWVMTRPPVVEPPEVPPIPVTAPSAPKPKPKPKPVTVPVTPETEVIRLANVERVARGLKPLLTDPTLMQAAKGWSRNQAARSRMYHSRMGYGENVAYGQRTPRDVHRAWMNSKGHRANILNPGYSSMGAGLAYSGSTPYWTQTFR